MFVCLVCCFGMQSKQERTNSDYVYGFQWFQLNLPKTFSGQKMVYDMLHGDMRGNMDHKGYFQVVLRNEFPRQHMSLFLQQNIAAATQSVSETKVRQFGETKVRQFAKIQSIAPVNQSDPRCDTKTCIREKPQNLHLRAEMKGSFILQTLKIMSPKSKISF